MRFANRPNQKEKISDELMHITDWYPTLVALAGLTPTDPDRLDGVDQSRMIQGGEPSLRTEILHNMASIIFGSYFISSIPMTHDWPN